ncbi:hypothetical protein L249_6790 [Ophiocordyceps polyrhachis-furcata BCC 54312]|uniref:Deacetylase sirtuin-type domain-containing protein n=1 Tax=Ophiocordyceps polyrhachis-furcata BCC 54312 TaxID=1330021 RepID=A0A367LL33_9HYPO|nr:hypothetical protein L249_6790 [Ophiocordyceps polyrhachis-furcata BCC 54312]
MDDCNVDVASAPQGKVSSPSSPLSSIPNTPSLPSSPAVLLDAAARRYPSPSSSTPSGTQSPIKPIRDGSPRPAKRRRLLTPRDRTTAHLDLLKPDDVFGHEDNFHLQRLLSALRTKRKIVVIAGAGISVSAGIPDFRSSTGLFATARTQHKLKASGKHLFDASVYKHDSSTQSFHAMVRQMAHLTSKASPTPFHHLVASLAKEGRLLRLYSQNIDCIDTSMDPLYTTVPLEPKAPWPPTIQLHGGLQKMVCTKCGDLKPFNGDLFDGPEPPPCAECQKTDEVRTAFAGKRSHGIGRLRPRFVLYNEFNPDEEAIGKVVRADLKARPDAVVVVGTTLKVPGTRRLVKEMCQVARGRKDGFTAWINIDPQPKGLEFKDCWDLVVRSRCDDVAKLAELPPYDCEIGDDYLVSPNHFKGLPKNNIQVGILSAPSPASDASCGPVVARAMPTPRPSPPASSRTLAAAKNRQTTISFPPNTKQGTNSATAPVPVPKTPKPRGHRSKLPTKGLDRGSLPVLTGFKIGKKMPGSEAAQMKSVLTKTNLFVDDTDGKGVCLSDFTLRPVASPIATDARQYTRASDDISPGPLMGQGTAATSACSPSGKEA